MRWFKHQTAAHADAKLKKLILRQGMAAYGLYWYCLELIGKDVCEARLTFEIEEDSELLAHATGMTREQVEAAMHCMVELGLFENTQGTITCLSMLRHIDSSMFKQGAIRERFQSEKARIMDGTRAVHVPNMDGPCKTGQDKTRQDKTEGMTPPNLQEVTDWFVKKGYTVDPETYLEVNTELGWVQNNGKPIKSWKQNAAHWQKNETKYSNPVRANNLPRDER